LRNSTKSLGEIVMDVNKLRTQVFEKTGIKLDTSDPVFALVALNEAVLEECIEQHVAKMRSASEQLKEQTTQLIEAGDRAKQLLLQMGRPVEDPSPPKVEPTSLVSRKPMLAWRTIAAAGAISVCSCLLVLAGQAVIGYPHTSASTQTPAPIAAIAPASTPALTPEQVVMMQNGEKYAKMWPKLDAKTQEKIKALMQ
jgi:hypothetical protein